LPSEREAAVAVTQRRLDMGTDELLSVPAGNMTSMSEHLASRTEQRRKKRSASLGADRALLGQFFTPEPAAKLIASMLDLPTEGQLRVLDPGAGVGSLTAALAARCAAEAPDVKLAVTAVEADPALAEDLEATLQDCGATQPGTYEAVIGDFVPWAAHQSYGGATYDVVIMNPPYRKITKNSPEEVAFRDAGVLTTNLYAGFVTLALRLLAPGGQLVAITPRSFANGTYFKKFRHELLTTAALQRIHVFEKRNEVFKDAEVLQENVIFTAQLGVEQGAVTITSSRGFGEDLGEHVVPFDAVVQPDDLQRFIHITTTAEGLDVATQMAAQLATLPELGLTVSTGRVVDFRSKEHLRQKLGDSDVPLVYPGHLVAGGCRWPEGAAKKPRALHRNEKTEWMLLPAGTYVVVKRFSAKEEPRRVVASLVTPDDLPGDVWAFENHLNVFHVNNHGMDPALATGLTKYLNSDLVDAFVRLFNGHTQINAGDLRSLRYPSTDRLAH
jgi:adenine-specific DNA-methyltransferase